MFYTKDTENLRVIQNIQSVCMDSDLTSIKNNQSHKAKSVQWILAFTIVFYQRFLVASGTLQYHTCFHRNTSPYEEGYVLYKYCLGIFLFHRQELGSKLQFIYFH